MSCPMFLTHYINVFWKTSWSIEYQDGIYLVRPLPQQQSIMCWYASLVHLNSYFSLFRFVTAIHSQSFNLFNLAWLQAFMNTNTKNVKKLFQTFCDISYSLNCDIPTPPAQTTYFYTIQAKSYVNLKHEYRQS